MASQPSFTVISKRATSSIISGSLLAERNWDAISELDMGCRVWIDEVLTEAPVDEGALREKLESLLAVYQQLLEVTTGERQAIFEEMSQINQAKNASKVYHLFV